MNSFVMNLQNDSTFLRCIYSRSLVNPASDFFESYVNIPAYHRDDSRHDSIQFYQIIQIMKTRMYRFVVRCSRITAIILGIFLTRYALSTLDTHYGFLREILEVFLQLIPTWVFLVVLILSRKRYPLVGALVFIVFDIIFVIMDINYYLQPGWTGGSPLPVLYEQLSTIALPVLIVSGLFFQHRRLKRKVKKNK